MPRLRRGLQGARRTDGLRLPGSSGWSKKWSDVNLARVNQPEPPLSRPRRLFLRLSAGVGGALAAAGSAAVALYEARAPQETPQLAAGAPVDAGKWRVTVRALRLEPALPDGRPVPNGGRALTLVAEVENLTGESSNDVYDLFRLATPPEGADSKPTPYLVRDRELMSYLQPRLPETLAFAWKAPAAWRPQGPVTVTLTADRFKPKDNLYAAPGWFNPYTVGAFALPAAAP